MEAIDLALHPDMGAGLDLEVAPPFLLLELSLEAFSISRGVVLWPSIRFE